MTVANPIHQRRWLVAALVALAALAVALLAPARSEARLSKPSSSYYQINGTSPVSGIQLSGYAGKVVYVAVNVAPVTATYSARVAIPAAARTGLSLPFGYAEWEGKSIAFTGSAADANRALRALTIVAPLAKFDGKSKANDLALTITAFELTPGVAFNPENQHFYRYVAIGPCATANSCTTAEQTARNPDTAKAAAEASKEKGLTGYLASITSAEENDFISSKIEGATAVIIGGRDTDAEGTWKWVGGPDNGAAFWQGCATNSPLTPGTALGFARWSTGEPNNFNTTLNKGCSAAGYTPPASGENCMVTNWTDNSASERIGYWNDVPCGNNAYTASLVRGYVVEYGDKPTGGSFSGVATVTATFKARPYVKNARPNFFANVFKVLSMSKKRKPAPPRPSAPATFTFKTKMQIVNPGTYVITIKRKDGLGVPFLLLSGSKAQVAGAKAVTLGSSRWSLEITTTKANQRFTFAPVLKTRDWLKPAGTKVVVELKTDPGKRCPLGWCQSTPIPSPRDQGRG